MTHNPEFAKSTEERLEVKSRKLNWQANMKAKYPSFTKKAWAKSGTIFIQD